MASSETGITIGSRGNIVDVARIEPQFKKDKSRTKASLTRARTSLLLLLEDCDLPSRREVRDACKKMDSCMEIVMTVLSNLSNFCIRNGDLLKGERVVTEMEKIGEQYEAAHETERDYLDSRKDNASSVSSGVMLIDLLQRMNFNGDREQIYQREEMLTEMPGISSEVRSPVQYGQIHESMPAPLKNLHSQCRTKTYVSSKRESEEANTPEPVSYENTMQAELGNLSCVSNCNRYENYQQRNVSTVNHDVSENSLNAHTTNARTNSAAREQTNERPKNTPSIEQDLW